MGVTIHFEGTLRHRGALDHVIDAARTRAQQLGWTWRIIDESAATLTRMRDEQDGI